MKRLRELPYHLMMLPGIIVLAIFSIGPMVGAIIAFQRFIPARGIFGSQWVGLDNFKFMFQIPDSRQVLWNTIIIAVSKITLGIIAPLTFALMLNEVPSAIFRRNVQTIVYLPHFLSWVFLSGVVINIFSYDGVVNQIVQFFGGDPILFMGSNAWFRPILILTDVWKEFGFGTIIYLAALTRISPTLYEASMVDGASKFKRLIHITLPGIVPTVVLMAALSLGNVLNAGFDQVFNMYNPLVYKTADIIDTYVYRVGLIQMQYGLSTAVGLLKSLVSLILIVCSYRLAYRFADYRIF